MTLWAARRGPVDGHPVVVDSASVVATGGAARWTTPVGRWTAIRPATRTGDTSSTIHTPYYFPCKNYIPFGKDPV
jgi:hypothetical protein